MPEIHAIKVITLGSILMVSDEYVLEPKGILTKISVSLNLFLGKRLKLISRAIRVSTLITLLTPDLASAQVAAGGLGTRVNGNAYGNCVVGSCAVSGGSRSGSNLFHRFSYVDTRGKVKNILLDTQNLRNVIVGVTHVSGSYLNKPLQLSAPANLFWLSPGGIRLGSGATVTNVQNLLLSTGASMNMGGNTFNVLNTKISDVHSLGESPSLRFSNLNSPDGSLSSLGLIGSGSIVLEGGLITVDRNLLLDSTGGNLRTIAGYGTQLRAGSSIRLAGHGVDLNDVTITAGEPGRWGLVDVRSSRNQENAQSGYVQLDGAKLTGQLIWITAGEISLSQSRLQAPKGWIQLLLSNQSGQSKNLTISSSILDVSAYSLEDLNTPVVITTNLQEKSSRRSGGPRLSFPQIGLFSDGDIYVSRDSVINASLDVSQFQDKRDSSQKLDMEGIADRSGLIYLRSKGRIAIDSSTISADASHNQPGHITIVAEGKDDLGGINLRRSNIFARFGAGSGEVVLESSGGIRIDHSTIDVASNHYPIVDGAKSAIVNGEIKPYAFDGGRVFMTNLSLAEPIQVMNDSSIIARQSTSGGGLESSLLRVETSDATGTTGFYGSEYAFSTGYDKAYTGGSIYLFSMGGTNVSDSLLDVSSGDSRVNTAENIGGSISILDRSIAGIELINSSLAALTAEPLDSSNMDHQAGQIAVAAGGNVRVLDSSVLASNFSQANVFASSSNNAYPWIGVASSDGLLNFQGNTVLDASYSIDRLFSSYEYQGINLFPGPLTDERTVINPEPLPFNFTPNQDAQAEYAINFNDQNIESFENAYGNLELLGSGDQGPSSSLAQTILINPLQQRLTSAAPVSASVSIVLDQNTVSSQLLEREKRALLETVEALGLPSGSGKLRSISELQERLAQAIRMPAPPKRVASTTSSHSAENNSILQPYTPAILHLQRDDQPSGSSRITAILLTAQGEPISRSIELPRADLDGWIRSFQRQLSRRGSTEPDSRSDPSQQLSQTLIQPLLPSLRQRGITALLLEVDRGLQAIPYGALPVDGRLLGDAFAITITPSLGLIDLDPAQQAQQGAEGQMLLVGASEFSSGLEPLPMVRQELQVLAAEHPSTVLLNDAFTPAALMDRALATQVRQLHIATHASFLPGQSSNGLLYTPKTSLSLAELGRSLRSRTSSSPLDLISLSGCVTALGDEQSELGFVGMALQAGARSGLGTLWEVDDAATAAFFIQFYRYLKLGLPKDQALQATHRAFLQGDVQLQGDRLVGPEQLMGSARSTLVSGLSREEQTLFSQGLNHPYYWAGMVLTGSPW